MSTQIQELSERIAAWAVDKGFWEGFEDADFLEALAGVTSAAPGNSVRGTEDELRAIAERVRTLTISCKLQLMGDELSEAHESLRNTGFEAIRSDGNFGEEMADTVIRILDTMGNIGIDLSPIIEEKMAVNEQRPHKHGRKM